MKLLKLSTFLFLLTAAALSAEKEDAADVPEIPGQFLPYQKVFCQAEESEACADFKLFLEGSKPEWTEKSFIQGGYLYMNSTERSRKRFPFFLIKTDDSDRIEVNHAFLFPVKKKEIDHAEEFLQAVQSGRLPGKKNKFRKVLKKTLKNSVTYPILQDLNSVIFIHQHGESLKTDQAVFIRKNKDRLYILKTQKEETGISGVMENIHFLSVFPCESCRLIDE